MIEIIKRMKLQQTMRGCHPTKIAISKRGMAELKKELSDVMLKPPDECHTQTICGLEIEEREELENGVMFIIS